MALWMNINTAEEEHMLLYRFNTIPLNIKVIEVILSLNISRHPQFLGI